MYVMNRETGALLSVENSVLDGKIQLRRENSVLVDLDRMDFDLDEFSPRREFGFVLRDEQFKALIDAPKAAYFDSNEVLGIAGTLVKAERLPHFGVYDNAMKGWEQACKDGLAVETREWEYVSAVSYRPGEALPWTISSENFEASFDGTSEGFRKVLEKQSKHGPVKHLHWFAR